MRNNNYFSNVFKRISALFGALSFAIVLSVSVFTNLAIPSASALTVNGGTDCSPNSVINCGVISTSQLTNYLPGHAAILDLYSSSFGINSADVSNLNNTTPNANEDYTVAGTVNVNNDVIVNGKIVATNAITAGRESISNQYGGSTKVSYDGYHFYIRTPRVSFVVASLSAFVIMKNDVFQFAILTSCGNPVKATPVPRPKVPTIPVVPTYSCTSLTLSAASSNPNTVVLNVIHTQSGGASFKDVTYLIDNTTTGVSTPLIAGDTNVNYTFNSYGAQYITATVNFLVNGSVVSATSPNCDKSVTIAMPSTPNYGCLSLTLSNDPSNADSVVATSTYNATGGATFEGVSYDFGDNSVQTITNPANLTVNHTYTSPGVYLVSATYSFLVGTTSNIVSSANCEQTVTFSPPATAMCAIPGLAQYPANSPNCVTVVPVSHLVNTGPGGVGIFAAVLGAVSVVAGTSYYLIARYRAKDLL